MERGDKRVSRLDRSNREASIRKFAGSVWQLAAQSVWYNLDRLPVKICQGLREAGLIDVPVCLSRWHSLTFPCHRLLRERRYKSTHTATGSWMSRKRASAVTKVTVHIIMHLHLNLCYIRCSFGDGSRGVQVSTQLLRVATKQLFHPMHTC